jgi:hypothetical protein
MATIQTIYSQYMSSFEQWRTSEKTGDCEACTTLDGWWCRGCEFASKRAALANADFAQSHIDSVMDRVKGRCESMPLVPCYLCNQSGHEKPPLDHKRCDETFWVEGGRGN